MFPHPGHKQASGASGALAVLLGCVFVLVVLASPASACSIVESTLDEVAWVGDDRIAMTLQGDVVIFDLKEGSVEPLTRGFFHRLAAAPHEGIVAVRVQEGLDSMCQGDQYLDFYDVDSGERLHRLPGAYQPLAGSLEGVIAGDDGMAGLRFFSWQDPVAGYEVPTGLPDTVGVWGTQLALRDGADVLAVVERDEARIHFVDAEEGGAWPGMSGFRLAEEALERHPGVAFEPLGTRVALLFTSEGRDRVLTYDVVEGEREVRVWLNVSAPEGSQAPSALVWTAAGIVTIHGSSVWLVTEDGDVRVLRLSGTEGAANVVADPTGSSWAVLVTDRDEGHRVLHFDGDGEPVAQWRQDPQDLAMWQRSLEEDWVTFTAGEPGDRSWTPPVSSNGDGDGDGDGELVVTPGGGEEETSSAAGPVVGVVVLVVVVSVLSAARTRRRRCGGPPSTGGS